MAQLNIEYKTR